MQLPGSPTTFVIWDTDASKDGAATLYTGRFIPRPLWKEPSPGSERPPEQTILHGGPGELQIADVQVHLPPMAPVHETTLTTDPAWPDTAIGEPWEKPDEETDIGDPWEKPVEEDDPTPPEIDAPPFGGIEFPHRHGAHGVVSGLSRSGGQASQRLRRHQRMLGAGNIDWDAMLITDEETPVEDETSRPVADPNTLVTSTPEIWIPNYCGVSYAVVWVQFVRTPFGNQRWCYLRRSTVANWCAFRRTMPALVRATVTGGTTGNGQLRFTGMYHDGVVTTGAGSLYLRHG